MVVAILLLYMILVCLWVWLLYAEITCTSPTRAPANGAVTGGTNTYSSVRQYSCNEGYHLSGTSYTICQTDGSWSTANPMCTREYHTLHTTILRI